MNAPALFATGFRPAELFDLPRPAAESRIVVAMSGGVDSSVVAALAAASGAEVIGITLQLYDYGAATGRKSFGRQNENERSFLHPGYRRLAGYVKPHGDAFLASVDFQETE